MGSPMESPETLRSPDGSMEAGEKIAMLCKPFLKCAGGKGQLVSELLSRVPKEFGTYHEPFLGGGALFFALRSRGLTERHAELNDSNPSIVQAFRAVRDDVDRLIDDLEKLETEYLKSKDRAAFYYEVREGDLFPASIIFLNKTCFNGLWRVNRSGKFNVPHGKYKSPKICDAKNLRACSEALQRAVISNVDFREARVPSPGDFVYFDPPYIPLSKTSNFTSYIAGGFTLRDQEDLRDHALFLKKRGVHVLLSNSGSDMTRRLYGKKFVVEEVMARRNINSKGGQRGAIRECLVR